MQYKDYRAIIRTGYDGWNVTYTEFRAKSKFDAFAKLLNKYDTPLDAGAIQEENITDFETLVNIYKLNANCDGGFDEILLLLQKDNILFQDDHMFIDYNL